MRGAYINFCNKKAFNLVDEDFKQRVIDSLKDNYYITISDRNFYIINERNINYIEKKPFILSVKSLGSLYYLYLTKIDGINYCIYINKKIKDGHKFPLMVSVPYRFDDDLFNNTLFDGELLRNNNDNWLYIINNLVLLKGEIMKNRNIMKKLNLVYKILTNNYTKDEEMEICPLYVKRLFGYHELDTIINEYIPSMNFKVRGLYFEGIKNNKNYLYLFHRNHKFEKKEVVKREVVTYKNFKKSEKKVNVSDRKSMNFIVRKTVKKVLVL